MSTTHSVASVFAALEKLHFGALNTFRGTDINSRFMHFACDPTLRNFYFLTPSNAAKINEISLNPRGSFSALGSTEPVGDSSQTLVIGDFTVLGDIHDPEVRQGLQWLGRKDPNIGMILESGTLGNYAFLLLRTREIQFSVYKELRAHAPKFTVRFDQ